MSKTLLTKSFNISKFGKAVEGDRFPLRIRRPQNYEFISTNFAPVKRI